MTELPTKGWRIELSEYHQEVLAALGPQISLWLTRTYWRLYSLDAQEQLTEVGFVFQLSADDTTGVLNIRSDAEGYDLVSGAICGVFSAAELVYEEQQEARGQVSA